MAHLLDAYMPKILTAEAPEKAPAVEIIRAPQEEAEAVAPPLSVVEPALITIPSQSNVERLAATEVVDVVEVDAQSRCCLENCDQIIQNLYLGGVEAALDSQCLAEQGIRAVVCCNRELEFPSSKFIPDLEYYRVDVEDMGREPIELFFPEATEFIHNQLLRERPVLVHCKAGVSRSASVLLAYLMEYCGYSLHDAFILTLRLRPTITPNPGFMERLREYEKDKCGVAVASIDINKYIAWFQAARRSLEPNLKPD